MSDDARTTLTDEEREALFRGNSYGGGYMLDIAVERIVAARVAEVTAERDDLEDRLSVLLCDLTRGKLSKPTYTVRTMLQAIEAEFDKDAAVIAAERDAAVAQVEAVAALTREICGLDYCDPDPHSDCLPARFRAALAEPERVLAERDARVLEDAADHLDAQGSARKSDQYGYERDYADGIDAGVEGAADWLRDRAQALREGR